MSRVWGTPQRLGRPGARRKVAARSGQPLRRAGGMGAGRLPCGSRALSPSPPPPLLLEPLSLLEQPPRPQHVSERAEPAAQAPSIHPTPLLLPQANPSDFASGSCSQSQQRHAPSWFHPLPSRPNAPHPFPPAVQRLWGVRDDSSSERLPGARRCLCARPFLLRLVPAPCSPKLPTASSSHPRPCPSPKAPTFSCARLPSAPFLSPAFGYLLRSAPSCSPDPLASPLPPVPSFPAERSEFSFLPGGKLGVLPAPGHLCQSDRWVWRRWFLGSGCLAECV